MPGGCLWPVFVAKHEVCKCVAQKNTQHWTYLHWARCSARQGLNKKNQWHFVQQTVQHVNFDELSVESTVTLGEHFDSSCLDPPVLNSGQTRVQGRLDCCTKFTSSLWSEQSFFSPADLTVCVYIKSYTIITFAYLECVQIPRLRFWYWCIFHKSLKHQFIFGFVV